MKKKKKKNNQYAKGVFVLWYLFTLCRPRYSFVEPRLGDVLWILASITEVKLQ